MIILTENSRQLWKPLRWFLAFCYYTLTILVMKTVSFIYSTLWCNFPMALVFLPHFLFFKLSRSSPRKFCKKTTDNIKMAYTFFNPMWKTNALFYLTIQLFGEMVFEVDAICGWLGGFATTGTAQNKSGYTAPGDATGGTAPGDATGDTAPGDVTGDMMRPHNSQDSWSTYTRTVK